MLALIPVSYNMMLKLDLGEPTLIIFFFWGAFLIEAQNHINDSVRFYWTQTVKN